MNNRSRQSLTQVVLVAVCGLGLGASAVLLLKPASVPDSLAAVSDSTSTPITLEPFVDTRSVELTLGASQSADLTVPTAGVITSSSCAAGLVVKSGEVPLTVSGAKVLALHLSIPPYRVFEFGVKGIDVVALQTELTRIGYDAGSSGVYDTRTFRAIVALQKAAEVPVSEGSFSPSDFMWLPEPEITLAKCALKVGAHGEAGTVFASSQTRVTAAKISKMPSSLIPGERTVTVGNVIAAVDANGQVINAEDVAKIVATPEAVGTIATLNTAAVSPLSAQFSLVTPKQAASVPGSAVQTNTAKTCVFDAATQTPIPVIVLASSLGRSTIEFTDKPPTAVISSPDRSLSCR